MDQVTDRHGTMLTIDTPVYDHDCSACVFLGGYRINGARYDVYFCGTQLLGGSTVVARWGSDGPDYTSSLHTARILKRDGDLSDPLVVALDRAVLRGLLAH